jgi:dihydrofolate reductase
MAKLIYAAFTSLDGYFADETGNFDWAELGEEVHAFINCRERQIGTYLFGRKMYETMAVWETPDVIPHRTAAVLEFAPNIAGSGNPYLPGKVPVKLELLDERRFDNGMVHVRYRAKS